MLLVKRIYEGIRQEGLNYGLPTLFVELGVGPSFQPEDLVKAILMATKCKWVCLFGEETTKVGMGTLVKGLSMVGIQTEVEVGGEVKDPGWLHTVDRWQVDYVEDALFNYGALRSQDMIRFKIGGEGDLNLVKVGLEELKLFPGTKVLRIIDSEVGDRNELLRKSLEVAREYDRCRIYW